MFSADDMKFLCLIAESLSTENWIDRMKALRTAQKMAQEKQQEEAVTKHQMRCRRCDEI